LKTHQTRPGVEVDGEELQSLRRHIPRFGLGLALVATLALVAGCNLFRPPAPPSPLPTPTMVATITPSPVPPLALLDSELLGVKDVEAACDSAEGAQITCENTDFAPQITVKHDASVWSRWAMRWQNAAPLTGDEVLRLRLTVQGDMYPNLYLVEQEGERLPVELWRFGLAEGTQEIFVPLREVKDVDGNTLDFSKINELQIVFEWADVDGTLDVESVEFLSVWQEPVALDPAAFQMADALGLPPGFVAEPIADDVRENTQIEITPDGDMLVSLQNGRIWWYTDEDGDGVYDSRHLYATGFTEVVGLLYDPWDDAVWVGGRGQLYRTLDTDGNGAADVRELRIDGLPWGRHQNNGLEWNPDPDPFTGEPGGHWIYFGLGSTDDLAVGGEYNASILRFPRDGQGQEDLEILSHGNRNAYDVLWAPVPVDLDNPDGPTAWQLFASENGPDYQNDPDEVNHLYRLGLNFGFPDQLGDLAPDAVEGDPYAGPVYSVIPHTSADGLAWISNSEWPDEYRTLYTALFGEVFNPTPVGHIVEGIHLHEITTPDGYTTYRGEPFDFVTNLDRPLPLTVDLEGDLLVGDYATGMIYAIRYTGGE